MKNIAPAYLCILALILLSGCTTEANTVVPSTLPPTPTLSQVMPSIQPELLLKPTHQSFPTADLKQASETIHELLLSNNGCELPCFWGISPGKTTWKEAAFLKGLASQYNADVALENQDYFSQLFFFPVLNRFNSDMRMEVEVLRNIVRTLNVTDFESSRFELATFLAQNGQPDEIWLFTNSQGFGADNHIGLSILFYYREKQMTVSYYGTGKIGDTSVVGCTTLGPNLNIWSWDDSLGFPESEWSNMNIVRTSWKTLAEATQGEFDVSKYYETFKDPQREPCITTPKSLWSAP